MTRRTFHASETTDAGVTVETTVTLPDGLDFHDPRTVGDLAELTQMGNTSTRVRIEEALRIDHGRPRPTPF